LIPPPSLEPLRNEYVANEWPDDLLIPPPSALEPLRNERGRKPKCGCGCKTATARPDDDDAPLALPQLNF
jgi:hypothetical protein